MTEARKSYMTKEQLEQYLADLRNNRPQRPSGHRPISISSTSKSRWSLLRSSTAPPPESPEAFIADPAAPPRLHGATAPPALSRRESRLIRKHSSPIHKRSSTTSSILGFVRSPPRAGRDSSEEKGWDGVDRQDGRTGDVVSPPLSSPTRKKRESAPAGSLRGFSYRSGGSVSSGSSSSSGSSEHKKRVQWQLPAGESSSMVMPPTHPPTTADAPAIEKELTQHFGLLSTQDALPTVAPLRINKTTQPAPSRTLPEPLPMVPERGSTVPSQAPSGSRRDYGATLPRRPMYVEPWKQEPTQHNNPKYTTNPDPLPSPPTSGEEEGEEEAEILKELGRRPLPKVGGPSNIRGPTPPQETMSLRKNTTRYGAQAQPPPPIIGIVEPPMPRVTVAKAPPPSISKAPPTSGPSRVPTFSFSDDTPKAPSINISSAPSIPSINAESSRSLPSINVESSRPLPTINLPGENSRPLPGVNLPSENSGRPLPSTRPLPHPRGRPSPAFSGPSTTGRARASCNLCRSPIEGRIVTAGSLRFHPDCFRCDHCQTPLEHVGFFPEPKEQRSRRLEKAGILDTSIGANGTGVRFYCHLDFHELFSPRCKSCKTPIEGEVVVACGSTWHQGHFFCAECGDPFDAKSKFVEKDGYAWCVGCYTKRYSGKCKKCKQPVTETVVKALGGEWHEGCFCCTECGGGFDDGRFFVRGFEGREIPVCVACEERRLKA